MQSKKLSDEIDLFELSKKVWVYKKYIFLTTASVSLVAGLYAFTATPLYKATALVETDTIRMITAKKS